MKKKVFGILLALCLALSLLPSTALAVADHKLYVGDTLVYSSLTGGLSEGTSYYWKAATSGDDAYTETGSANDYLFSVSLDESSESFTLTLNGVNITSSHSFGEGYNIGIYSNTQLEIVLSANTQNIINVTGGCDYGIYIGGALTVSGTGALTTSGGTNGIVSWGAEASLDITGGTIDSSGTAYGIMVDGNVTISGGTVHAVAESYDGISTSGNLTVSGGNVTASGSRYALGINGITSISADPYKFRTNTSASAPDTNYTLSTDEAFANADTLKYVEIMSCPEVYVSGNNAESGTVKVSGVTDSGNISYWLNDESGSITSTGAVAENYNVKYNELTQTLTLKDASITSFYSANKNGVSAQSDLNLVLEGSSVIGTQANKAGDAGISCDGNLSISSVSGGSLSITSDENGIDVRNDISITGSGTSLNIDAGNSEISSRYCGINSSDGKVLITDAAVSITKNGTRGDALWADDDIRISGGADISIVDWSTNDGVACGLHSQCGCVAIGGSSQVDICSKRIGIYASYGLYLGYVWNGSAYTASGSPTVKINSPDSVAAITSEIEDDFTIGSNGIRANNGSIYMADGTLTAVGNESALYYYSDEGSLTLPSSYKYKSNTAAVDPGGNYTYGAYTYSENDKYLEIITGAAPIAAPSNTITVTETSSALFNGAPGAVKAEANMTNAFSNSVEVKVTDTQESASNFGLGAGNTVYPFDISLYIKGTDTKTQPAEGYAVTIYLPIPETMLDEKEQLSIVHKSDSGKVSVLPSRLVQVSGVWYLVFEATEFSPYALAVNSMQTYDETAGLPYYLDSAGNRVFIGFAANGKYIAPEGKEILFFENGRSFSDVYGHWAFNNIRFVTEREIFLGTGGGAFSPNSGMTRAMFATVIGRLYERSFGEIEALSTHTFTDCNYNDYYGKYVDWAAKNGIIGGYGDGLFGPGDMITREQMAAILYRFADFLGAVPGNLDTALTYSDAASISSYAKNAALYCQTTGIITGRGDSCFAPGETASRAEVAAVVERFVKNIIA
ncbi:MAG: carbohydrate-binding domain-containing protein [Clostridia bacterium]|nr:carbohydrate-binding domain-containing protein [Clostridia bacterium]